MFLVSEGGSNNVSADDYHTNCVKDKQKCNDILGYDQLQHVICKCFNSELGFYAPFNRDGHCETDYQHFLYVVISWSVK